MTNMTNRAKNVKLHTNYSGHNSNADDATRYKASGDAFTASKSRESRCVSVSADVAIVSASVIDLAAERRKLIGDYDRTEDGIALAFAERHKDDLRYCHTDGRWHAWTGTLWRREETRLAFHWARNVCRELNKEGSTSLAKAATAGAVERFAQADRAFAVTSEIWDGDPFLLGTPGGTVDLRTGKLREARREDLITRQTEVAPDFAGEHPLWTKFLNEATSGNEELQRYMQQIVGYCLTGDTREQALFFVFGNGGNGKGVFLSIISRMMGDYATKAAMDTFVVSVSHRHETELAMLDGARMVCASETEEGRAWAESRIKELTGGDEVSARFMRQDFFTFKPTFKLLFIGNYKPVLQNVDDAMMRRTNMIPFVFKPTTVDMELEDKLRPELPQILAWAIRGCLDWQANGLVRPAVVTDATCEYFQDQDTGNQWIEECCELGRNQFDTRNALFKSWTAYATAAGEPQRSAKWFRELMRKKGCRPVKSTPGHRGERGYLGIAVKTRDTGNQ